MAATPEGVVKKSVKKALVSAGVVPFSDVVSGKAKGYEGFFFMPVAGPFAVHGVHDFVGCWDGLFFSIETKSVEAREDATPLQLKFQEAVTTAGGIAFVGVRDDSVVSRLRNLVDQHRRKPCPSRPPQS
jgi:hypothetical protein